MDQGFIRVTSIRQITIADITPELARRSGFAGVIDLLKVAKHGPGENVYLIEFEYRPNEQPGLPKPSQSKKRKPSRAE
ncbi:MAG: hypothetical protein ACREQR_08150 [Candidatus Binataceae bacterium]